MKTYKLKRQNALEWHVKDGRRIVEKIKKSTNGWICAHVVFESFDDAVQWVAEIEKPFAQVNIITE